MSKLITHLYSIVVLLSATDSILYAQLFKDKVDYYVGSRPWTIVSADFDNDGDFDLATAPGVTFNNDGIGWIAILENNGNGKFSVTDSIAIGDAPSLETADLDTNGYIDLIASDVFTKQTYILMNDGSGAFAVTDSFASGRINYTNSFEPAAADLDGDGDYDLAVPIWPDSLSIFFNNGQADFSSPTLYPTGYHPFKVVSADLDHDSDSDLVVTNNGAGSVSVMLNNGNGTFASRTDYSVGIFPQGISVADYNKDGCLDLSVANASPGTPYVSLLLGNCDGTFDPKVDYTGCRPHSIASADYDCDGDIDMAVANNECNSVSIFRNNGNGTFASHFMIAAGTGTNHVVAKDFDGDGDFDLAAENFDNDGIPGYTVSVFINRTITPPSILDTVFTPPDYPDSPMSAIIHIPDQAIAKGIGVVMMHGLGAPPTGNQFWRDTLVAYGYLVMAVVHPDLNVSPNGLYPRLVRAAKTAVQFLRKNALRFGITTGKIIGWGQSQGAMIWGQSITWDNDTTLFGTDPETSDHVDAAILLYGLYDMSNHLPAWAYDLLTTHFSEYPALRTTKGQALTNAANITTPLLLLHATGDPVAYIQHSRLLRDSLNKYGKSVKLIEFNSSTHTFDAASDTQFSALGLAAKDSALVFLDSVLSPGSLGFAEIISTNVPANYALVQNYPNPFNPTTNIRFTLPVSGFMSLKIYDVLGREVAILVNEEQRAGSYEVRWNAIGFSSGVYFYRLQSGEFVQTKKLLLMK